MNSRQRRKQRRNLESQVDRALQAMWDSMPSPEWIRVVEPITLEGKTIEPGFYVRDANGDFRHQDAEALA